MAICCENAPCAYLKAIGDQRAEIERMTAENERLRAAQREAFRAGYWEWCGPANGAEYDRCVKDEQEAWEKYALNQQLTSQKE